MENSIDPAVLASLARVRTVVESDLPGLEWDGEYTHYRRMYADAFARAQYGRSVLWVVELPDVGLVGQAFVQLVCDRPELADGISRAYIYGVRVQSAYRSLGLGTRLLHSVENDLLLRDYRWATLNVARDNVRARQLYERSGYRVVAPEPGTWSYQDDKGRWHTVKEPAWRMEKRLR